MPGHSGRVLWATAALLALTSCPLAAQGMLEERVQSLKVLADSLIDAEDYAGAAVVLESVVELLPADGEAWYRLGVARYYRGGAYVAAAAAFDEAAKHEFRTATALYNAGSSFAVDSMASEALERLNQALDVGFSNKYVLLIDPGIDLIRDDPAWQKRMSGFFGTEFHPELSQPIRKIENAGIQQASMRDGVDLATEIVLPEGRGPFPTILVRTPYGKGWQVFHRSHWAARGYALVVQDVRGRGDSGGIFEPWLNEREDGFDTVEWIRGQPWSDGKVGMIGASYAAQVQWLAAAEAPEGLVAMIPLVSGTDPFFNTPYDHGILKQGLLDWSHSMTYPDAETQERDSLLLRTLPLLAVDDAYFGADVGIWNDWVRRGTAADWRDASFISDMSRVSASVLHVSGLWDVESIGTVRNWKAMTEAGLENRWLVFGPWAHQNFVDPVQTDRGDVDYGEVAAIEFTAFWVRFFDHWLKGKDVGWSSEPRARVFITGSDEWVDLDEFPPENTKQLELYLSSDEHLDGSRSLNRLVGSTSAANYRYDPATALFRSNAGFSETTVYPTDLDSSDEIRFSTAPLDQATTVLGMPELKLHFSTDVPDTDFFVLLLDIDEAGTARAVGHPGKIRAGFVEGWNEIKTLESGRIYLARIPMFPVAHRFDTGHRIGVVIRSDWFPRFARNLNTGEDPAVATRTQTATQTLHLGDDSPSVLLLPTLPASLQRTR